MEPLVVSKEIKCGEYIHFILKFSLYIKTKDLNSKATFKIKLSPPQWLHLETNKILKGPTAV